MAEPVAGFNTNPQNINKKGAPKRAWTVQSLIEQAMEEQDETGVPYRKIVYKKLVKLAAKGDIIAIKELNNRLDGMPHQSTDITSGGKQLPVPIYGGDKNAK